MSTDIASHDQHTFVRQTQTRYGRFSYFTLDDPIGKSLSLYGEWAQSEINFLCSLIQPGATVIDLGANIGTHTIALAQHVQETGRVIAVEPQPEVVRLLRENVKQNTIPGVVEIIDKAIDRQSRKLHIGLPNYQDHHNSGACSIKHHQTSTCTIASTTLDTLAVEQCDLIKLDIEGWEIEALAGGTQLLQQFHPLLYAECNNIDLGWELINVLRPLGYCVYLHSPPAFSSQNFKQHKENIFGLARESNLLFVPHHNNTLSSQNLAQQPYLEPISTLEQFASAFLSIIRYGEKTITNSQALALARRLQMVQEKQSPPHIISEMKAPPIQRPICVLIPIYNGFSALEKLFQSIFSAYPQPIENLFFYFINDASTDPMVYPFLQNPQCKRKDFSISSLPKNVGFVKAVNFGLQQIEQQHPTADVTLLNSDTIVSNHIFEKLQQVSMTDDNIASVTPWTNNGTIASLFDWPHGSKLPSSLTLQQIFETFQQTTSNSHEHVTIPTGVGFCMYLTRQALQQTGLFNAAFGIGYGEENDWCERAKQLNFRHVLATDLFVYHQGNESFGSEVKAKQLKKNMSILEKMHPQYFKDVTSFIESDPLYEARLQILWKLRNQIKKQHQLQTLVVISHNDPQYYGGGTEKHILGITQELLIQGTFEIIQLFPIHPLKQWCMRVLLPNQNPLEENSSFVEIPIIAERIELFLHFLGTQADILHVQHWIDWPQELLQWIPTYFSNAQRIITLHDYYSICPSIRLAPHASYCHVPSHLPTCNDCLHHQLHQTNLSITKYRKNHFHFLASFHQVVVPSEAAKKVLSRGFLNSQQHATQIQRLLDSICVVPNFLPKGLQVHSIPTSSRGKKIPLKGKKRIIFLGGFSPDKGSSLFNQVAQQMANGTIQFELWGNLGDTIHKKIKQRMYANSFELRELSERYPVNIVVLPAVWPETFSFTTFEALIDIGAPIVVGPYGNPAEIVKTFGVGEVLTALTADHLQETLKRMLQAEELYKQAVLQARHRLPHSSLQDYIQKIYPTSNVKNTEAFLALTTSMQLPALRGSIRHERIHPPHSIQLRHQLINQINQTFKTKTPLLHQTAKQLMTLYASTHAHHDSHKIPLRHMLIDNINQQGKKFLPHMHRLAKKFIHTNHHNNETTSRLNRH